MNTKLIQSRNTNHNHGYVIFKCPDGDKIFEVNECLVLGRDSSCQIVLGDPFASHRHARIEKHDDRFVLRDLRSRNGTYINGTRVMEAALQPDDRIRIGQTDLVFCSHQERPSSSSILESLNPDWSLQLKRLPSVASSSLPILICGPSGAGKEIIAQTLHRLSPRTSGPFFSVNCSALGEALISSELFGHVRGSFTGAIEDRAGAFEVARGGTLFLDEIGDLPIELQPKLLRALENHEIRPVGSDKTIRTDVRIIAATHHDLRKSIREGRFRADLYYRLNVVHIPMPALKNRLEDFETFLYQFAKDFRTSFTYAAIQSLKLHSWPGNLRELKNVVARGRALYGSGPIDVEHLDKLIERPIAEPRVISPLSLSRPAGSTTTVKEMEIEMIRRSLIANKGNQRRTSQDLGIPKSTLHDRIKAYGIDIKQLIREQSLEEISGTT